MSYPYPPMDPGQQPPGGQPPGWGQQPYGIPPPPDFAPPPYGQPPGGYPPFPPPPPPKGGGGGVIAIVIVVALIVVGGAFGGAYYVAKGRDDRKGSSSASSSRPGGPTAAAPGANLKPGYYNSMDSWSLWNSLNTRAQDSRPLTLDEVFKDPESRQQKDSLSGTHLNLRAPGRIDTDCGSTVWGASLKQAVQADGCTQVLRASFVSTDQRWVGMLAIFNLRDVNAANQLINDMDPEKGDKGFFVPLTGAPPVDRFGKGTTGAESGAYGHFVVVGWAGHSDGVSTSSSGSDTIGPSSAVQRAGKEFLFDRS